MEQCLHTHQESTLDEFIVCMDCGLVITPSRHISQDSLILSIEKGSNYSNYTEHKYKQKIKSLCNSLNVSSRLQDRIWFLFLEFQTKFKFKNTGNVLGACIYCVCRENAIPMSLGTLYVTFIDSILSFFKHQLGTETVDYFGMGRMVYKVQTEFHLSFKCPYKEMIYSLINSLNLSPLDKIVNNALALVAFSESILLNSGRHPSPWLASCTCLSLESLDGVRSPQSLYDRLSNSSDCAKSTLLKRYNELKKALMEYAMQCPCFADVQSHNFYALLSRIIEYGQRNDWKSLNHPTYPPAFQSSLVKRVEIEKRMNSLKSGLSPKDSVDYYIQKQMQRGYSEQEIYDFNPLKRRKRDI